MREGLLTDVGHASATVRAFRQHRAKLESPRAMRWVATAILGLSLLNLGTGAITLRALAQHLVLSLLLLGAASLVSHPRLPERRVPVIVAACTIAVIAEFQYELWADPGPLGVAYVLMIIIAAGPFLMSSSGFVVVAIASYIGCLVSFPGTASQLGRGSLGEWFVAALGAEIISGLLVFVRLRGIDELGELTRRTQVLASTDALTGLLNRHGLERALDTLLQGDDTGSLYTCFVDIDGLKVVNDQHGHDLGDRVIRSVGAAITAAAPRGSIIARWGGDEFVVVGTGRAPDVEQVRRELTDHIAASGIAPTQWPGTVSVGVAGGLASRQAVEDLIHRADAHMYERRRDHRDASEG